MIDGHDVTHIDFIVDVVIQTKNHSILWIEWELGVQLLDTLSVDGLYATIMMIRCNQLWNVYYVSISMNTNQLYI